MDVEFLEPQSLQDAIAMAKARGSAARFIAGGTDLIIQARKSGTWPATVINLQRLTTLGEIKVSDRNYSFGSLVTHRQIESDARFAGGLQALQESACVIGGHQVRNVATVGGNICNASPAADMVPILLCLNAEVSLAGPNGSRVIPLAEFTQGPRKTQRASDEVMTEIIFSAPARKFASAFLKGGRRRAMEISIVAMAGVVSASADGKLTDVRLAMGAAGPKAIRLADAEKFLEGKTPSKAVLEEVGRLAAAAATPIDDVRASASFRRHLAAVYARRVVEISWNRISEVRNDRSAA
ncbi:MAG: xanthine dehydrogenase family protein subunit M [Xanthobacteraceae bacterium]|nr:xanthine dehydrogenase family protein subunit M [Xanthobacteraceae bacterium]QYK45680.1 MAG: xanthine dehydrogenase family protein subunit M [Xanthobacteraceae bacterium]